MRKHNIRFYGEKSKITYHSIPSLSVPLDPECVDRQASVDPNQDSS